jgi:hypothetical protein
MCKDVVLVRALNKLNADLFKSMYHFRMAKLLASETAAKLESINGKA